MEKLISIERSRLRAEGRNRRDSGDKAWRLADKTFRDDSIRLAAELRNRIGSTPPNLSLEQALAWRLAIVVVAACTQRSPRLGEVATALVVQSRLRAAMDRVGVYRIESRYEVDVQKSFVKFSTSTETCLAEVDCLMEVIKSIDHTDQNDGGVTFFLYFRCLILPPVVP